MKKTLTRRETLRLMASTSSTFFIALNELNRPERTVHSAGVSVVYMTKNISAVGLMKIYNALGRAAEGNTAVKISSGEPGGHYFLSPQLIAPLVQAVKGTIVECNTAYGGLRSTTDSHRQVMKAHGFTAIASTDILDADGSMSLPVVGGVHLTEDLVGAHLASYDFVINLAHFKGHVMGGFGGVIKNMSVGIASSAGKSLIHSAGTSTIGLGGNTPHDDFLESMAEAAKGVADFLGERILHINVMNNLSVDCDCDSSPAAPTMGNIGILASLDPVALDQACVDRVYAARDGQDLIQRMESRNGIHTLEHAEAIGLGSRRYTLINLDVPLPAPVLISPLDRVTTGASMPTFDWSDVPNAGSYLIQLDRRRDFLSPDRIDGYSNMSQFTPVSALVDRPWYWRVKATDPLGSASQWSDIRTLYVNAIPTPVPTLQTPADGLVLKDMVFTFTWSGETGVRRYNIQIDNEPTFTTPMRVNVSPLTNSYRNTTLPLSNGIWYWRVRAQGIDGFWGTFSPYYSLTVDRIRPGRPMLVSPPNGQPTADNTPDFIWNLVPDADVVGYVIQIDKTNLFNSAEKIQQPISTQSYTPGTPLADRKWFWRVAAIDAAGNVGTWSPIWSVIISTTASPDVQVIQSDSAQVQREGQWQSYTLGGGSYLACQNPSAALSLTFTGSQIAIVYAKQSALGMFAIEVDGQLVQTVNSRTPNAFKLARVTIAVAPGEHMLRIVTVKGSVVIDAFVVTP